MLIMVGIDPDDGLGDGEKNVGSLGWMLLSSSLGPPGWGRGSTVPLENILIMAPSSNEDYSGDYHEDNHEDC